VDTAKQLANVDAICRFALLVREAVQVVPFDEISFVKVRMGIHCGPIVTGISGSAVPRFSCFGDSINTASRMESTGVTNKIHVSGPFADMVRKIKPQGLYSLEQRPAVDVKGKGLMQTFFLEADLEKFRVACSHELQKIETLVTTETPGCENWCLSVQGTLVFPTETDSPGLQSSTHSSSSIKKAQTKALAANAQLHRSDPQVSLCADDDCDRAISQAVLPFRFSFLELSDPDFDVLHIDHGDFESIALAILVLFEGVIGSPNCMSCTEPATLDRLVRRVGHHYRFVPYHSWHHALCVVQQTAAILMRLLDSSAPPPLSDKERFMLMLAALVHDVDHPGHSNFFEVASRSSLALLYNDQSVLENHHLALAFNIMSNASYDVFRCWTKEETTEARKIIIACVLATDMSAHESFQEDLLRRAKRMVSQCNAAGDSASIASLSPSPYDEQQQQQQQLPFNLSNKKDVIALCCCLLHAADISNPTRPFSVSAHISMSAIKEFQQQAEAERELNLPVTPHMVMPTFESQCRGEVYFCLQIARPYFAALKACFPGSTRWDPLSAIDANAAHWREQAALSRLVVPQ